MKFNPPPTWPTPLAGWEPDASWSPDPSWPPPPPGWPLWVEDSTDAAGDVERSVRPPAAGQVEAAVRNGSIAERTMSLLVAGAGASFVLTLISLIDTISRPSAIGNMAHTGPSVGVFLALVSTAALCYFGALAAQDVGARLPIVIPGPRRR